MSTIVSFIFIKSINGFVDQCNDLDDKHTCFTDLHNALVPLHEHERIE